MFLFVLFAGVVFFLLDYYNLIPTRYYFDKDFDTHYEFSGNDYDHDGVDDYVDMLNGARNFVLKKPKYKSEYYDGGYPPEGVGVCTDVVAAAFKEAGYDLRELVDSDILENREEYSHISVIDKNIDYRRVKNLKIFFERNAIFLTTDISDIDEWQGGDIVLFESHIAIVSDKRNKHGVSYIIHHGGQPKYEEDGFKRSKRRIVGHYRFSMNCLTFSSLFYII